ncbi:adenosylcobinamide-GDP ribazoletransferase [Treponema pedis]|uniref:Adenosylcobinamide-GDP ribazoletransferase n=1 Tax=Treponema pedis TaxID=409322 RepID=A0A7S6WRS9_9SPIR|nr:adenosylcobinamide-GDP ribazoletransferase [Treponema pedis]QOW61824.1 adenosylcobinamide-GDP ribazoletransferase [Treponema pedis]
MKGFILALQFFTRIPIPVNIEFTESNLKKAFFFLPLIGAVIGAVALIPIYFISNTYLEEAAGLSLILYLFLTGGLHIDGLADTLDGFLSAHKRKEKILEIMSDPRIGSFGTTGISFAVLSRYIAYAGVMPHGGILILAGIISRLAGVGMAVFVKPAKETGLGILFHKSASKISFFFWLIAVCILCLFTPEISSFSLKYLNFTLAEFSYRMKYLLFPLIAFFLTFIIAKIAYKKIDGTTGDVNGCAVELTELAILFSVIFIQPVN